MPAKPLSTAQLADASALKAAFKAWQNRQKASGKEFSQEWAADKLGFGQSATAQYLNGRIPLNVDAASKFSKLIGVPVRDFSSMLADEIAGLTGATHESVDELGRPTNHAVKALAGYTLDNIRPVDGRRPVPLISWVQAGMFADVQDNFHPGEADSWVQPIYSRPGPRSFALVVDGLSMVNPYPAPAVSFPPGTVIVVDPDLGFSANSFVIAKDVTTQRATFKQLVTDAGVWFLKPLNPAFPTVQIDDPSIRVIGTVAEYQPPGGKL